MRLAIAYPMLLLVLHLLGAPVRAADTAEAPGAADYLRGIDSLQQANWGEAEQAFSQALTADEENPDYYTARGVARTLAEKFPQAIKDYDRSLRLRESDFETTLWLSAAYFMSDDPAKGSSLFSHGRQETHDYAHLVHETARIYMTSRYRGGYHDIKQGKWIDTAEPVKTGFPTAARAFAARRKGSGGAVSATAFARAKELLGKGDFAAAFADLELVLPTAPDDPDVLYHHARAALELGDLVTARRELTRALTHRPDWADAYIARARAAAGMGDAARATADIDIARKLGAAPPALDIPQPSQDDPVALLAKLREAATSGNASWPHLVERAAAVNRAMNARRIHFDETYQDRLRELLTATRAIPTTADSLAALGEFLFTHATAVRGEAVEPRVTLAPYRIVTEASLDLELQRAEEALDAALKIAPDHINAMTFKAACLMWRLQWADAEQILQRALPLKIDDPRLLTMMSRVLDHAANTKQAKAHDLRATDTWEDLTYIYWRYPTASELRLANEYELQAQRLWALAVEHLAAAAQARQGTAEGFYYEGILRRREGNAAAARAALEQAVKLKPDYLEAHDQLAGVYTQLNMTKQAFEQQLIADNLVHTTGGPMLRLAWLQVPRTAWKSAKEAIARAESVDPADPRCAAYLGRIAQGQEDLNTAVAQFRVAAALLEAKQRLGTRSADAAMAMAVRMHLGQVLRALGKNDEALAIFQANLALEPKMDQQTLTAETAHAMLPDPSLPSSEVPVAERTAVYLAWSHIGAGQILLDRNRPEEAEKHFIAARELETGWPATTPGRDRLFLTSSWARYYQCKVLLARGETDEAFRLMTHEGFPSQITPELQKEIEALRDQIIAARKGRNRDEYGERGGGRSGGGRSGDDDGEMDADAQQQLEEELRQLMEEQQKQQDAERQRLLRERQRHIDERRRQRQRPREE